MVIAHTLTTTNPLTLTSEGESSRSLSHHGNKDIVRKSSKVRPTFLTIPPVLQSSILVSEDSFLRCIENFSECKCSKDLMEVSCHGAGLISIPSTLPPTLLKL